MQPIAVDDCSATSWPRSTLPAEAGRIVEIGGADVLTYGDMMPATPRRAACSGGSCRCPVLTPLLSSYWVDLVTPIPSTIARPLIEGLRSEVVVRDDAARALFPEILPVGYADRRARRRSQTLDVGRRRDLVGRRARTSAEAACFPLVFRREAGMLSSAAQRAVAAPPRRVFAVFSASAGGAATVRRTALASSAAPWTGSSAAWACAAAAATPSTCAPATRSTSGGSRRVEPAPPAAAAGRDEGAGQGLAAVRDRCRGGRARSWCRRRYLAPKGLPGLPYWYACCPVHSAIFSGMIAALAAAASRPGAAGGGDFA